MEEYENVRDAHHHVHYIRKTTQRASKMAPSQRRGYNIIKKI